MKVIIAGGRKFDNYALLCSKLDLLFANKKPDEIVSGRANGADLLGERYAKSRAIKVKSFPVTPDDWNKHGKKAGFLRNQDMAKYGTHLVAFWDGESRGTASMIELAKAYGLDVRVVKY